MEERFCAAIHKNREGHDVQSCRPVALEVEERRLSAA
jgi:hypothetical protein